MFRAAIVLMPLILILVIGGALQEHHSSSHLWVSSAYIIALWSLFFSWKTDGFGGYRFWVTLIAAYPLLTPFIVRDILSFDFYSARATDLQTTSIESFPFMISALSCLFFSLAINKKCMRERNIGSLLVNRKEDRLLWLVIACSGMVFFAWLTEPGSIVGISSYSEVIEGRIQGVNFAGGAWAVFSVLAIAFFIRMESVASLRSQNIAKYIFFGAVLLSTVYLILHARRSEVSGFLLLLLVMFGGRVSSTKKAIIGSIAFISLVVVGAIRNLVDPLVLLTRDFYQLPGGPGNVLIGYVASSNLVFKEEGQPFVFGETYIGHLLRVPPAFLGLDRPSTAYDYINSAIPLTGGEYYLVEPMLNFGIIGIVFFLLFFAWVINLSMKSVNHFMVNKVGLLQFLISGTILTLIFRTMWYGINPLTKGVIMAMIVALFIMLIRRGVRKRYRQ